MNNLNSVLIEGNLIRSSSVILDRGEVSTAYFTIRSMRYYKAENELVGETCDVDIKVPGRKTAQRCDKLEAGQKVRVVGRLSEWSDSRLVIVAEHVETMPRKKLAPSV